MRTHQELGFCALAISCGPALLSTNIGCGDVAPQPRTPAVQQGSSPTRTPDPPDPETTASAAASFPQDRSSAPAPGEPASVATPLASVPVLLASAQRGSSNLAQDCNYIYWTWSDGFQPRGFVMRVSKRGGNPETVVSGQADLTALAVDASFAYWTNSAAAGKIMKISLNGGRPEMVAVDPSSEVAVDASNVYWFSLGRLKMVSKRGGTAATLATGDEESSGRIALDSTHVYWTNPGTWEENCGFCKKDGSVMKVPIAGGKQTTLVAGQPGPGVIAVDSTGVYYATENVYGGIGDGRIMKLPLDGGRPEPLATNQSPSGLAIDESSVYWPGDGAVLKVSKSGGAVATLASISDATTDFLGDETALYWLTDGGSLMKLQK